MTSPDHVIAAPLQGTVTSVAVQTGDVVVAGQTVVVIESMKMEHVVVAETAGVVTTVAIRPEPMPSFCANPIRFIATNTINPPTKAELRHCAQVGSAWPCHSATSSITPPAHRKRMAFMSSGGMLVRAMPMAKYVVPQTT